MKQPAKTDDHEPCHLFEKHSACLTFCLFLAIFPNLDHEILVKLLFTNKDSFSNVMKKEKGLLCSNKLS